MKKFVLLSLLVMATSICLTAQTTTDMDKSGVTLKDIPEMNVVYYDFTGPYDQSFNDFNKLLDYLKLNNIPLEMSSIGIFYDDPATVSAEKLRSSIGFLVTQKVPASGIYKFKTIPAGKAVSVKYTSMDEIMQAYTKIGNYIKDNAIKTVPYSIELYTNTEPGKIDAEILFMVVD